MHYTKLNIKPIKKLWDEFDIKQHGNKIGNDKQDSELTTMNSVIGASPQSFSSWLPNFYDEVLIYLEQEWKWYISWI